MPKLTLLDQHGNPLSSSVPSPINYPQALAQANRALALSKRQMARAKYDAAQTFTGNENHWSNADHFDPHTVANLRVRRTLRSRSRYEIIENNPYLKGTLLTICNDFVGRGPRLQITDDRISPERQRIIEKRFMKWSATIKLRHKLWRMRMAKVTDGETFLRAYANKTRQVKHPVFLDFQVIECDRISSQDTTGMTPSDRKGGKVNEVDGVRFDNYEQPLAYHVLHSHPGGGSWLGDSNFGTSPAEGDWVDAKFIVHWFRQDRGWLRGIPETTPSLPLCALLRRYTLSMVRHAEVIADFTGILETDGPANVTPWTDGAGNALSDDPFDEFPIEMGMFTNLPWGYKMKQLEAVPLGTQYDQFVGSLLREITRPILSPFNISAGTSKDSNMASSVVDHEIYRGGQSSERESAEEEILDPILLLYWQEAVRISGYLGDDLIATEPSFRNEPPDHAWRWDRIGFDHTDPQKVASALETLSNKKFLTDRDIQEMYYNRDVEDWRKEVESDDEWRAGLLMGSDGNPIPPDPVVAPPPSGGAKKPKPKK